ncbi:ImmA/IrrE family metallo-endopeptidase [Heyndrickxia coagulans]|uniref:ImmA/IrrE family metallo-endopeptidase n=1 Tax=Heyndrickxia coagulans TaxID=1398 RepID=UPI002235C713|nr:ImmA/IrrE family metallo-endopeptidase [Heyndrickxia coagulans]UZH06424.1 ImmA/IrrE family metallo-endopeptidase [Heyndrickxia coagulans]
MDWIKNAIHKEVKKHKSNDPFKIASSKNILIRYLPLGSTLGFYEKVYRQKIITLNHDLNNDYLMRYVCAHELGHAVLHADANTPFLRKNTLFSTDRIECEANFFATQLLLYDKVLEDYETKFDVLRESGIPYEMERFL